MTANTGRTEGQVENPGRRRPGSRPAGRPPGRGNQGATFMGTTTPAPQPMTAPPAEPVPLAFLGRTSTLLLQDPVSSLNRQLREVRDKLPPGWFIAAHYWDIESGGMDLDQRGHGTAHEQVNVGIPRDGGMADLLAEAAGPAPGSPP